MVGEGGDTLQRWTEIGWGMAWHGRSGHGGLPGPAEESDWQKGGQGSFSQVEIDSRSASGSFSIRAGLSSL